MDRLIANGGTRRRYHYHHGIGGWFRWWERLLLSDAHHSIPGTVFIWFPSIIGFVIAGWTIYRSLRFDPEVRIRPHKRAWHVTESRHTNGSVYHCNTFAWMFPSRCRWLYLEREKGFEELDIPTLDSPDTDD